MCNTRLQVRTAPAEGWKSLSARFAKTKTINSKEPLNKLAEFARAHRAKHKERRSIVQSALSSDEREPCIQCRVVCRYSVKRSRNGYQCDTHTKHLSAGKEDDSELNPALACRLFAE